jgi:hypothetical protein
MEEFEEIEVLGCINSFKHVLAEIAQVGIATGYALDSRGSIPGRGNFSFNGVHVGSGSYPTPYTMAVEVLFHGAKAAGS